MARNKYPEETVQKILDVSRALFREKGYEHTTIQDIEVHWECRRERSTTTLSQRKRLWTG